VIVLHPLYFCVTSFSLKTHILEMHAHVKERVKPIAVVSQYAYNLFLFIAQRNVIAAVSSFLMTLWPTFT